MYWNFCFLTGRLRLSIRLTLTWDVLKLSNCTILLIGLCGLTLTWDVLKSAGVAPTVTSVTGLTLTWDVLKLDYYYGMDTTSVD